MAARLLFRDSDARILDQIREGDQVGLVELYRSCRSMVTAYIRRNSGNIDDAEDLLQEALVVLWERVRAGKFELNARLETFIMATVKNIWLRRLARKRREVPGQLDAETIPDTRSSVLDDLIDDEQARAVRDALETLGDPCKSLLLLFYWEELPMDEIAKSLGFANADTVKSKKYQCKKALEALLKESIRRRDQ